MSMALDIVTESSFKPLQIHMAEDWLLVMQFVCTIFGFVLFNHVVMYINFKITCILNTYFFLNSSLHICMLLDTVRPISIEWLPSPSFGSVWTSNSWVRKCNKSPVIWNSRNYLPDDRVSYSVKFVCPATPLWLPHNTQQLSSWQSVCCIFGKTSNFNSCIYYSSFFSVKKPHDDTWRFPVSALLPPHSHITFL